MTAEAPEVTVKLGDVFKWYDRKPYQTQLSRKARICVMYIGGAMTVTEIGECGYSREEIYEAIKLYYKKPVLNYLLESAV